MSKFPHVRVARLLALLCGGCVAGAGFNAAAQTSETTAVRQLLAEGRGPAAQQRLERALAERPRDAELRFMLGVVLMETGQAERALSVFTQLTQEHPNLPDPFNNQALLLAQAGRLDEALAALHTALRNDPGHRTARVNLGQVHLMLALRSWDQLAEAGPVDPALRQRMDAVRRLVAQPTAGAR